MSLKDFVISLIWPWRRRMRARDDLSSASTRQSTEGPRRSGAMKKLPCAKASPSAADIERVAIAADDINAGARLT